MNDTLELWDFELRECIRSWNALGYICGVISISEDQVACEVVKNPGILLDTARTEVKEAKSSLWIQPGKALCQQLLFMGILLLVTVNVT